METGRRAGLLSQATLGPAPNLGFGRFLSSAATLFDLLGTLRSH
jgi:hypothetical protein